MSGAKSDIAASSAARVADVADTGCRSAPPDRRQVQAVGCHPAAGRSRAPSAPSRVSQNASQVPLKPVWPVRKTRLPRQNAAIRRQKTLPRRLPFVPQGLQHALLPQRIHRLPEALVLVGLQFAGAGQRLHRGLLPDGVVALDQVERLWRQHEEAAVDPLVVAVRLFLEAAHRAVVDVERAKAGRRANRGHGGEPAVRFVEGDRSCAISTVLTASP